MSRNKRGFMLACAFALGMAAFAIVACTSNDMDKNWGGSTTVELEAGQKLENITWKDADMWMLTTPMEPTYAPKTHEFVEKSSMGILNGKITVVEKR